MTSVGRLLADVRHAAGLTLHELAARSGTSAPTLSNYENGLKEPRLSTITRVLEASGFRLRLDALPLGADRPLTRKDRRSLAMHRLVAQRLTIDPERVRAKAVRNLATLRRANTDGHADAYVEEWTHLLDGPTDALVDVLVSERQSARDLRQVSPFAGVLTDEERRRLIRQVR